MHISQFEFITFYIDLGYFPSVLVSSFIVAILDRELNFCALYHFGFLLRIHYHLFCDLF